MQTTNSKTKFKIENELINRFDLQLYKENIELQNTYYCVITRYTEIEIIKFDNNPVKINDDGSRDLTEIRKLLPINYYEDFDNISDKLDFIDVITRNSINYQQLKNHTYGQAKFHDGYFYLNIGDATINKVVTSFEPIKLEQEFTDLFYTYTIAINGEANYIVISRESGEVLKKTFKEKPITIKHTKEIKDKEGNIKQEASEFIDYNQIKKLFKESNFKEFDNLVRNNPNKLDFDVVTPENSIDYPAYTTQNRNGVTYFNMYKEVDAINNSIIKSNKTGDYSLITTYLTNMFGGEAGYNQIVNFLAYRYQNPLKLVDFSFVLTGNKQIGKSLFVEHFLSNIFGERNITATNISNIEQLNFNSNIVGKMFVNFNEFHLKDINAIEYFKHKIKAKKQELHIKGKEKEEIPNLCSYIFTSNSIPSILEDMADARRFVVRKLSNKLYAENSTVEQFINQIPYFINYISKLSPTQPIYEDFDCCNDIMDFNNGEENHVVKSLDMYIQDLTKENGVVNIDKIGLNKDVLEDIYSFYCDITGKYVDKKETCFKSFKTLQEILYTNNKYKIITKTSRINDKVYLNSLTINN